MGEVQSFVENHLKDMVLKTFDPKKADTIFSEEGEVYLILNIFYCIFLLLVLLINKKLLFYRLQLG